MILRADAGWSQREKRTPRRRIGPHSGTAKGRDLWEE